MGWRDRRVSRRVPASGEAGEDIGRDEGATGPQAIIEKENSERSNYCRNNIKLYLSCSVCYHNPHEISHL